MVAFTAVTAQAATKKLKLSKTSVSITSGKTKTVTAKGSYKKIKASAKKKGFVKITVKGKKIKIRALKAGTVKITVKGYNKKGKLAAKGTITVKIPKKSSSTSTKTTTPAPTSKPTSTPTGTSTTTPTPTPTPTTTPTNPTTTPGSPSASTINYNAGEYSISKVHSGEGTFYDRTSGGAANLDDYESTYYTAAMNNYDYMNGLAGAYIEITDKDGQKVNVLITDRLPEGKTGDIDLTRKAFKTIEPEVTGRMKITWKIIPLPTSDPISFLWKPTSTAYWAQVQVRNNRYPIKSLEYLDKGSNTYKALPREEYNYFTAASGMGAGPYTFRVTDFYGHQLIQSGIAINTSGTPVKGTGNFPY